MINVPFTARRALLSVAACTLCQLASATPSDTVTPQQVMSALQRAAVPSTASAPSLAPTAVKPAVTSAVVDAGGSKSASSVDVTDAQGNVAELMRMIQDGQLKEWRTTYNGSYGASLFFEPSNVAYYVALFQDKHFWRVIRTLDVNRAEAIYREFAAQTLQLADVELRRFQLQAQKAYIDDTIALSEQRARRLQADLDVARTQQEKVAGYQREARDATVALRAEKDQAQAQLRQVQMQVQQLQMQSESGLPAGGMAIAP